jgi:uncharacterized cysteine cluster protein YcgN (CxxCxxCC family)
VPAALPFWKTKPLHGMSRAEWESLCDGCGRCCLHKLRDEDTEKLAFTEVACRMLDTHSCLCKDYPNRKRHVPDCVKLTPAKVAQVDWLPPSCAYRLVAEGRDLFWWHPLISGDPETVHSSGASVRDRAVPERKAGALEDHVVRWPGMWPKARQPKPPAKAPANSSSNSPGSPAAETPKGTAVR